jgi:hypothetical protein
MQECLSAQKYHVAACTRRGIHIGCNRRAAPSLWFNRVSLLATKAFALLPAQFPLGHVTGTTLMDALKIVGPDEPSYY